MAAPRPATIDAYIAAAPAAGQPHLRQPHLRQLHALLQGVAPKAEQVIKWGHPCFVEPRKTSSSCPMTRPCPRR